ncbi:MAG TPA: ABC transporter ATP-binding protein [Gammaproteobacteria bacterium]|jgi:branched-chain amino acid transport system ATP-binding protein|nr:ABC transporter ATP-binding protein [Gammaproteobacteria bacterium]PHS04856.1 MAG: ABC transporter ATP-binding protein [Acidithiobacillus sp.]RTZ64508.1 MAG: ABC transporter ATP-binding protein [Gammaproteobacteria bacterium]HAD38325.1 ABC transporter ATP-binding protein [Gammaproteobacteria bacterium]HBK78027.1 ABC transporter ATP-binding protein [Gammaproteobacteria bacterium]|tara:strand:- start:322 stop:1050 length:729 start_codon:yes stop_codon:yes gene_type:complete
MAEHSEEVVLETRNLYVGYYKDLNILQDLNIKARKNQITAILGANGVGKSTALRAVFGFLRPNEGEILLQGESIVDVPTHKRILKGLAYIPQQPGVFKDMSVEENLQLGGWTFKRDRKQIQEKIEANYERFPVLKEKRKQITGELSGGQQRMVEISRTLMAEPKMLLVDEPTAGLSKMLSEEVYEMLTVLTEQDDLTILLVDQEIRYALQIADYVYVLELGRNKFEGPASDFDDLEKAFWVA